MMKHTNLITRILCMILLLAILNQYQVRASQKAEEEAANAKAVAEVEAYNREIKKQMEDAQNASPYANGKYEGQAEGFGGPIKVSVTIDAGDITDIAVLSADAEDPAYYQQAQAVLGEILSTQGVTVDTVSGATFSSTGLINAVTEALRKAVK